MSRSPDDICHGRSVSIQRSAVSFQLINWKNGNNLTVLVSLVEKGLIELIPEVAFVRSVRSGEKVPLLWGWLCGQRQSVKYDLMLERSIGLGLTDEICRHAARSEVWQAD